MGVGLGRASVPGDAAVQKKEGIHPSCEDSEGGSGAGTCLSGFFVLSVWRLRLTVGCLDSSVGCPDSSVGFLGLSVVCLDFSLVGGFELLLADSTPRNSAKSDMAGQLKRQGICDLLMSSRIYINSTGCHVSWNAMLM